MVRLGLVFVVLLCCVAVSSVSWAISGGPGGYVYWSSHVPGMPWYRPLQSFDLNRATIDGNWDNVGVSSTWGSQASDTTVPLHSPVNQTPDVGERVRFDYYFGNAGVEVLDPRAEGGDGLVIRPNIYNATPGPFPWGNANDRNQPWDIVVTDPAGVQSEALLSDGKMASTTEWDSQGLYKTVVAPSSWTSHLAAGTLALVNVGVIGAGEAKSGEGTNDDRQDAQTGKVSFLWDQNGNGVIDNDATEGDMVGTGVRPSDVEAGTTALFVSGHKEYLGNDRGGGTIDRYYRNADGTYGKHVYFDYDGKGEVTDNNPVAYSGMGAGIAVGPEETAPIVYMLAHNGITDVDHTSWEYMAMYALRDGDGDNVVDYTNVADNVVQIWSSDHANDPTHLDVAAYSQDSALDVELWINPDNGARILLFNTNAGELFALELSADGMAVVDGKPILDDMNVSGNTYRLGFELDLNVMPAEIPEPATMLLVGTGLLGLLRITRRRKTK